jgi:hypothetical protein
MAGEFIRVTVVFEYEVDPELYPGASSPGERVEIDRKNFTEDPKLLVDTLADKGAKSVRLGSFTIS